MPVLRSSTTSTSAPPAPDERVTVTTGEAPVFTPTPEELSAGGSKANSGGPGGGRVGDTSAGAGDLRWITLALVGAGTAGLAGAVLVRRRKDETEAGPRHETG